MKIINPFSQTKNSVEGHSCKLEQVEDRISELEDKIEIKEKTENLLVKQFKGCENNMPELSDSITTPNLRIMGIEEGEEMQAKEILNIFNKITTENFPNLEKDLPIQVQEPPGHQIDLTKTERLHNILSLKQLIQRTEEEY
jgi:chromosome segregation ATPase